MRYVERVKSRSRFNTRPRRPRDARASDEGDDRPTGALRPVRKQALTDAFAKLWQELFESPVHLDSALAKRPSHIKSKLAQIVTPVLLRPASLAEAAGVGLGPDEPWELEPKAIARWRAAQLLAERLYVTLTEGGVRAESTTADFPPTMVAEWERDWGVETARALAKTLGMEPPLALRAAGRAGAAAVLKDISGGGKLGVKAQVSDLAPNGVRIASYAPVMGSETYKRGEFEIQDEGSQLMALFALWPELYAPALGAKPGEARAWPGGKPPAVPRPGAWNVIDACAGAGGKSLALADAMQGKGRIYSYDVSLKKLQALRRRATRAGVTNIQAVQVTEGAEKETLAKFRRRAQVVLVDAPCSGWGVLRRNPDIKWRQDQAAVDRMPEIQKRLLSEYSDLVAPGGRLVFGVCTFRKAESVDVVEAFLKAHPDFTKGPGGYLGPGPSDGFFMQSFTRKGKAE